MMHQYTYTKYINLVEIENYFDQYLNISFVNNSHVLSTAESVFLQLS